ncbi:MAG: hypothetical protein QM811_23825 [Pirellulales bacterium]
MAISLNNNWFVSTILSFGVIGFHATTAAETPQETQMTEIAQKLNAMIVDRKTKDHVIGFLKNANYECDSSKNAVRAVKHYKISFFVSHKHILNITFTDDGIIKDYTSTRGLVGP